MAAARRLTTFKISGEPSKFVCHACPRLMLCLGAFSCYMTSKGGCIWLMVYTMITNDHQLRYLINLLFSLSHNIFLHQISLSFWADAASLPSVAPPTLSRDFRTTYGEPFQARTLQINHVGSQLSMTMIIPSFSTNCRYYPAGGLYAW
jgi:hypothetical protein